MANEIKEIFAVIDPTTDIQRALTHAISLARRLEASVHAYLCCFSNLETDNFLSLRRVELARHAAWLDKVIEAENVDGVTVTTQVEWNEDWRHALKDAVSGCDCDIIVKSAYQHHMPTRHVLRTSDWEVLRNAKCPVLLLKRESTGLARSVLVAVNPNVEDIEHQQLNAAILSVSKQIKEINGDIELHAICSYTGAEKFIPRAKLAELFEIEEDLAHCLSGPADDAIVDLAKIIDPDLVVIGTVARTGITSAIKGNTAERIFDRLDSDFLVITAAA